MNKSNDKQKTKKTYSVSKRLRLGAAVFIVIFLLLIIRIFWLQVVDGADLKEQMYAQLIANEVISPKRGTIYDSTGKQLAISVSVDTVSINPNSIVVTDDNDEIDEAKTKALKEKVAKSFSEIFELDYEETLKKVSSTSSVVTIASKVEKDKIDKLKEWMETEKIYSGINIDEDTKRYYPYENLASSLLGFCGTDNQGLEGIEAWWDSILTGTPGKIVTSQDAVREYIPDENEKYVAPENGNDLTLTIDANIQSIVEKYLKQACIENNCTRGGNAIVMDPQTGDILAMATYPDYDLNDPFTPIHIDEKEWDKMDSDEQYNTLTSLYRNRAISDGYEPGSVFKILTSAIALEEDLAVPDKKNVYACPGYEIVSGEKIWCSHTYGHGSLSLRQALAESCNPAFMQIAAKIGSSTMYKYFDAFGLFNYTGIDAPGETNSIFWDLDDVGPVELATMSFGQRFKITPLQMITAVSAIANDGVLMKPRIVKEYKNVDTGVVTTIDPVAVRQVVSEETSDTMLDMLESVITDGTGQYAQVKGYSIAGKTGTSEPDPSNPDEGYTASFVAISPVENPEIVLLITLYDPNHGEDNHQGSSVAGPVVNQILTELLPYLDISSNNTTTNNEETISLPDVTNKTIAEAKKILEKAGFECVISGNDDELVSAQVPAKGSNLIEGSIIKLYSESNDTRTSKTVPDLKDKTLSEAKNILNNLNLNISITGSGTVVSQEPIAGTSVEEGSIVKVTLQSESVD